MHNQVRDITVLAILTCILFILEEVLSFLPNIQVTFLLIVLYSKVLGSKKTSIIVIIHVILDNLFMGTFNILYVVFQAAGLLIVPITLNTLFKKVNGSLGLAILGIFYSIIYSVLFMIPACIIGSMELLPYYIADIPFEILLALSSFLTILWLYEPLKKVLNKLINKETENLDETI